MAIQILLVHANADNRTRLIETLHNRTDICISAVASSGREALEQIKASPPDVVVVELNLPDMDGIQATGLIRAADPRIKLLIQTDSFKEKRFSDLLKSGVRGCLTADCTPEELTHAIRTIFQGKPYFCNESQELLVHACLERSQL